MLNLELIFCCNNKTQLAKFTSSFYLTFLVDTTNTLALNIINEPPEGKLETKKRQLEKSRHQQMFLEKI